MAESTSYPQIPSTVWWGARAVLNKTPRISLDETALGVELGVQTAAARQYVTELKRVGLLDENYKATDLAHRWRMPDTYSDAVSEIIERAYGDGLLTIAPTVDDRSKAIDWFQRQGLGEGSARNKAATYFLIASSVPADAPAKPAVSTGQQRTKRAAKVAKPETTSDAGDTIHRKSAAGMQVIGSFPINLNLQIHISADASVDQIEAIFSSMQKYLGNARVS
ncbi:hypothetical protein [Paradevosia shaoguanensis]|uniref:hypothetical protein n=1 Tax=Paradevosia shaoguanensis TaxID=1335043 RepID=UPI003C74A196